MKVYISGKITNDSNFKEKFKKVFYEIFEKKEELFPEAKQLSVFNPASMTLPGNPTWEDYMRYDLKILLECDAIYMIKDWKESEGAKLEHTIAQKMKMKIIYEE